MNTSGARIGELDLAEPERSSLDSLPSPPKSISDPEESERAPKRGHYESRVRGSKGEEVATSNQPEKTSMKGGKRVRFEGGSKK